MKTKCSLEIPANKQSVIVTDAENGAVLFEAGEKQAWRIVNLLPPIIGGSTHYLHHSAEFFGSDGQYTLEVPSDFDLDSKVIIELAEGAVKSVSVVWT